MTDTLLVSISSGKKRKEPNEALKIVNAFYGNEAVDIYKQLTTVRKNE